MKKDLEWLKNEVNELPLRFLGFSVLKQQEEFAVSKDDVLDLIDQLDEAEVLSQEWIIDHIIRNENTEEEYVYVDELQNAFVPKPELPVVPAWFDKWWKDVTKGGGNLFHNIERFYDELFSSGTRETYDYISSPDNKKELLNIIINELDYVVEEEQKYILSINITDKASKTNYETFLSKRGIFHSMDNESFNSEEFNWTEEEIKDLENGEILFEHFAVKVEELEQ